ncbi:MAG: hypothetical protein WCD16_02180, partial [Paracoccaceae bacterium]
FGSGTRTLSGSVDVTLNFHSDLPASDLTPLGADATTDPLQAAFVQVEVLPRSLPMAFVSAVERLLGRGNDPVIAQVGAEAVAGFTQDACDITPLMFCLPSADFTARPGAANSAVGRMIRIRSGGQGAAWGPGDFGFLDPSNADLGATCSGKNGVNLIACLVGAELNVTQCYSQRGVDTEPGQKVGIEDAIFNVRFDIYKSTMNGEKNSADYPPAPNVLSGLVSKGGKSCIGQQEQISPDTLPLPRDNCFASNSCDENNRFGDGDWSAGLHDYLMANHDIDSNTTDYKQVLDFSEVPTGLRDTRYGLYLAEIKGIANNRITPAGRAESGVPQCNKNPSTEGARRRVVIAAGIDCGKYAINGKTKGVPVNEFFEVFLTEPVGDDGASPPTLDLWGEVIGSAGGTGYSAAGTGGIFRDVVQLYR